MITSRKKSVNVSHRPENYAKANKSVGLCKSCGHKITLCCRNFTADIEFLKCHNINEVRSSQQPVSVRKPEVQ